MELLKCSGFVNSLIFIYLCLIHSQFESRSPERVFVRRELDQLLTWTAGNGVLFQLSIKIIKNRQCVINVMPKSVRLIAVSVGKQYVLINLNDFFCVYVIMHHARRVRRSGVKRGWFGGSNHTWNSKLQLSPEPPTRGHCSQIPVLSVLCPQLNLLKPPKQNSWVRHWSDVLNSYLWLDFLCPIFYIILSRQFYW
jgi:hypothetical protein